MIILFLFTLLGLMAITSGCVLSIFTFFLRNKNEELQSGMALLSCYFLITGFVLNLIAALFTFIYNITSGHAFWLILWAVLTVWEWLILHRAHQTFKKATSSN